MELTALTWAQLGGALGGFAAAVTVLYLLKLRRRRVEVPFVHLWQQVLAERQTTRLLSSLKRLVSWLIALSVVAGLVFAVADPRPAHQDVDAQTTVVLVDASASMQATDVAPHRLAEAADEVRELIEGLDGRDRMLVAQMDTSTVPLSPLTADATLLQDALGRLSATDVAADLDRGLRLALDVLHGQPRPRIVIVSDGGLTPAGDVVERLRQAGIEVSGIAVGAGGRNVAITAFSVRRYPLDKSRSEVLVELWNPTERDEAVELSLLGDGEPIEVQRLAVRAGERLRRVFANVSGADRTLEARVSLTDGSNQRFQDDQPADDRAYARLPERRRARVQAVTEGNLYLSAALLLDEYLDVVEVPPAAYPAPGRFDVTIFDGWVPASPPETHAIYLNPVPTDGVEGPFEIRGTVERPFFDVIDRDHPIVQFTALGDVNLAEGLEVVLQRGDRIVAGDRGAPLLVTGTRNARRIVALLFDVRRSDLPLRVAWPMLLLNSVDHFMQEDAGYLSSYETGQTWSVPIPADATEARLVGPDGTARPVPLVEGRAITTGLRAGFYQLHVERASGSEVETLAANLGPGDEARIEPTPLSLGDEWALEEPTVGAGGSQTEVWMMLVLAALVVVMVEWFSYHRRVTV